METGSHDKLTDLIRELLSTRSLTDFIDDSPDIPDDLFSAIEEEEYYIAINSRINRLTPLRRKILIHICRGHDPGLIGESLDLESPEQFWKEKKEIMDVLTPGSSLGLDQWPDEKHRNELLHVFQVNEEIVGRILEVSDELDQEHEKRIKRLKRRWSFIIVPAVLLILFLFIYPLLVKPDPAVLFDRFSNTCIPELQDVDTTLYWPGQYYEACRLFREASFTEAEFILRNIAGQGDVYSTGISWLLALIYLNRGMGSSCREQLEVIRETDPVFYRTCCRKLAWMVRTM